MAAEFITLQVDPLDCRQIAKAARALAEGALLAFPTETVYGVAANAAIADSVERLRRVKGRGASQPFTVHIGQRSDCEDFVPDLSHMAQRLIRRSWPGPVTLVLPVADPSKARSHRRLSPAGAEAIYMDGSVAVRCPDHEAARELLLTANAPIIASSANPAGVPAPSEAEEVRALLGDSVDLILDGGPTRYRRSSTIVAVNGAGLKTLRPGVLDDRTILRLATLNILLVCTGNTCRSPMAEGILRQLMAEKLGCSVDDLAARGVAVVSAGTLGLPGGRASREAIEVCRRRGIDISAHTTRMLSVELLQSADCIYTMACHHLDIARTLSPAAAEKTAPLDPEEDIVDPIGGTTEDYERVAEKITAALRNRLDEVPL